MKKNNLLLVGLMSIGLLLSSCGTGNNDSSISSLLSSSEPDSTVSTESSKSDSSSASEQDSSIIHGHGAPNNSQGSLYSLYVDDDTGKIYEKNKPYNGSSSLEARQYRAIDDDAKWIYTNCIAGENFDKESPVADALRSTLLATNITLKATDHVVLNREGSEPMEISSIAYLAFNTGSVMFKTDAPNHEGYDNAIIRGYSLYNIDENSYKIFFNDNGGHEEVNNFVDHTDYLTDGNPSHYGLALRFTKRCFTEYIEASCSFPLFDTILKELDNFTVNDKVYALDKAIVGRSDMYDSMYGEGVITFSNIEFKLSSESNSIDYLSFRFAFQTNDNSISIVEDIRMEASNLRKTSFAIPE